MHNTYMPSVLIETGFLTNYVEGKYLSSKKGQQAIAGSIANAILDYKDQVYAPKQVFEQPEIIESAAKDEIYPEITFKVQIAASSRNLETEPFNFKGLDNISKVKSGKIYRYFYGETSNYTLIKQLKDEAQEKGYPNCFIISYKNGERISLKDALN